jgi:hypothetical protein
VVFPLPVDDTVFARESVPLAVAVLVTEPVVTSPLTVV